MSDNYTERIYNFVTERRKYCEEIIFQFLLVLHSVSWFVEIKTKK